MLLRISYSRIACKMADNEQIMKSVMLRHVSRCVLYSGVWIAPLKVFMRITCWTDFVSEFVPSFYLHNSFSDCGGKTTHKLLYGRAESPSSGPLLFRAVVGEGLAS